MNTQEKQDSNEANSLSVLSELKGLLLGELTSTLHSVSECAETFLEEESGPVSGKEIQLPSTKVALPESHLAVEDLNACEIAMAGLFTRLLLAEVDAKYGSDFMVGNPEVSPNHAKEGE